MLLLLLLQLCLRLLLLLALLLLAQRALHGIERCEAAAPHDLFDGDAAHGVRVLKCTVGPFIHGWSRIVADSLVGKSFLALSERADRGVGWAAAPSSTVSSKVITLPESSASWLSIRAAYGTGTGPLRLEPRVTAPGVEIRHQGGRKVNPLPTALLALVSRAPRER